MNPFSALAAAVRPARLVIPEADPVPHPVERSAIVALARRRAEAFRSEPRGQPRTPPPSEPIAFCRAFGRDASEAEWGIYLGAWVEIRRTNGGGGLSRVEEAPADRFWRRLDARRRRLLGD